MIKVISVDVIKHSEAHLTKIEVQIICSLALRHCIFEIIQWN